MNRFRENILEAIWIKVREKDVCYPYIHSLLIIKDKKRETKLPLLDKVLQYNSRVIEIFITRIINLIRFLN